MEDSTNQDQQMTITEEQNSVASSSQDRLVKIKQIDGSVVDIKVDPNVRREFWFYNLWSHYGSYYC